MDHGRIKESLLNGFTPLVEYKRLDVLSPHPVGDYAEFRGLELASAINRLRTLSVRKKG